MVRHYCDVCGRECRPGNDVILNVNKDDEHTILPIQEQDGTGVYRELCSKCARNVAIYIIAKCKDDN